MLKQQTQISATVAQFPLVGWRKFLVRRELNSKEELCLFMHLGHRLHKWLDGAWLVSCPPSSWRLIHCDFPCLGICFNENLFCYWENRCDVLGPIVFSLFACFSVERFLCHKSNVYCMNKIQNDKTGINKRSIQLYWLFVSLQSKYIHTLLR